MNLHIRSALLLAVIFASCTEIYFPEPQPKGVQPLKNGFQDLIGEYLCYDEDGLQEDTVKVTKTHIQLSEDEFLEEELGEEVVVKKYKGHYFINFHNKEKDLWQLMVVESLNPDSLRITNLTCLDPDRTDEITQKRYVKLVEEEDDDYIIMNPSKGKLMKLVNHPVFDENRASLGKN